MNQAYGFSLFSTPCWAVPVLPPTVTPPPIWAFRPVPSLTTVSIIDCRVCAFLGDRGWLSSCGSVCAMVSTLDDWSLSTMYGFISLPLLATAEATMAICSGVAAVLYWPIQDSAVCEEFMFSENT